jgi:Trk-type K+ transport system membrane component
MHFAAVSTGGFSTRVESISYWDSAVIEAVPLPLMILGTLSLVTAWFLWRGKLRFVICNGEVRMLTALISLSTAAVFVFLYLITFALGAMLLCANGYGIGYSLFEFASAPELLASR